MVARLPNFIPNLNVGQSIGTGLQLRENRLARLANQEKAAQKAKTNRLAGLALQGNQEASQELSQLDPEMFMKIRDGLRSQSKEDREMSFKNMQLVGKLLDIAESEDPKQLENALQVAELTGVGRIKDEQGKEHDLVAEIRKNPGMVAALRRMNNTQKEAFKFIQTDQDTIAVEQSSLRQVPLGIKPRERKGQTINLNTGQNAFLKESAKQFAGEAAQRRKGAEGGRGMLLQIGFLKDLMKGENLGRGTKTIATMKEFAKAFGHTIGRDVLADLGVKDNAPKIRAIQSLLSRLALSTVRSPNSVDGGLPGATSNRDLDWIERATGKIESGDASIELSMAVLEARAKRQIEADNFQTQYLIDLQKRGLPPVIDHNFQGALNAHLEGIDFIPESAHRLLGGSKADKALEDKINQVADPAQREQLKRQMEAINQGIDAF